MCGITGIYALKEHGRRYFDRIDQSIITLQNRGPDGKGKYIHHRVALGHTRLAIIDPSEAASQPFTDHSGRYTIIYNGEFYNYREHRQLLESKGYQFKSTSDTETLLYLYISEGPSFIEKVNGCFALAIFDNIEETLFLCRDRMGICPLLIYRDDEKLIFASEMKSLLAYGIPKKIDYTSLYNYLQFNYIPEPYSIFAGISKLIPGTYLLIRKEKTEHKQYYTIPYRKEIQPIRYDEACQKIIEILRQSVQRRLVSDVPVGAFLSGGIDSSIVVALASEFTSHLNTFSIGYKDEPYFDETHFANLVAKKYKTNHTVFSLTNQNFLDILNELLDYIDEPFADSSVIAGYILCRNTRGKVKVALSGDGGDEIFAGYNKHKAHLNAKKRGIMNQLIRLGYPVWEFLPSSRNSKTANLFRQLKRYSAGLQKNEKERYWLWCSVMNEPNARQLLNKNILSDIYSERKNKILKRIPDKAEINDYLYSDMHLVLQGDMLRKSDLMSLSNGLEIRTPFLDHELVDFVFSLPGHYKIDAVQRKKILKEASRSLLPEELYNRPKQGFEVPLLKLFRYKMKSTIVNDLLESQFIKDQGIFNHSCIEDIKNKLFSVNPGDSPTHIWNLIVFQNWWKKYFI